MGMWLLKKYIEKNTKMKRVEVDVGIGNAMVFASFNKKIQQTWEHIQTHKIC